MQILRIMIFLITILLRMNCNCAQRSTIFSNTKPSNGNNSNTEGETAKLLSQLFHNQNNAMALGKTFYRRRFFRNPCLLFGRQINKNAAQTYSADIQGRFLWNINIYNTYPHLGPIGCGGGLPILPGPYNRFGGLLNLFVPGVLQNPFAATLRPQFLGDIGIANEQNILQNNDQLLQNNDQQQRPLPYPQYIQGPYPILYNTFATPALTPAQLIGGISTTVNDVIQRLVGTAQPVYPPLG